MPPEFKALKVAGKGTGVIFPGKSEDNIPGSADHGRDGDTPF